MGLSKRYWDYKMSKIEKYNSYKDSGVKWLGKIPREWEVKRIKHLFKIGRGRVISQQELDDDGIYPVYSSQTKNNGVLGYIKTFDFDCRQITWTTDGANAGTVFLREGKHNCTNVCGTLQTNKNDKILEFINYALQISAQYYKRPDTNGAKIMNNEMGDIPISYPAKQEQIKIASFLDTKTQQLDKAIKQKEKLINLLKERRQIIINDAVTKGIDKTVTMKDSGVEWIGEIPEGWEVKKNKYLFFEVDERSSDGKEELLSVSHMTGVTPRSEKNVNMFMSEDYTGSKICSKNDLVINIMWAWMGAMGIADRTGIISSSYGIYRQIKSNTLNTVYLEYLLKTNKYIEEYNKRSTGLHASRLRLYSDMFFDMKIGFAPPEEQQNIVDFIEEKTSKIDKAIDLQQKQITKLKEYKTTLIDSVVTGKVRVYDE
jgi:type I restriction enzyme S subunit